MTNTPKEQTSAITSYLTIDIVSEIRHTDSNESFDESSDKMILSAKDGKITDIVDDIAGNNESYSMDVYTKEPLNKYIGKPVKALLKDIRETTAEQDTNAAKHDWDQHTYINEIPTTRADFIRAKARADGLKKQRELAPKTAPKDPLKEKEAYIKSHTPRIARRPENQSKIDTARMNAAKEFMKGNTH